MPVLTTCVTRARTGFPFLDEPEGTLAFAHRGGAYHPDIEGLENTLAAFQHAWELGYTYLETDVHATRDGVLLAFHDEVLDRVTDRQGAIRDLLYADVQAALVGGKETVPTLAQLFDGFPEAKFNIDLKSPSAVRPLAEFIAAREAHDRVLVGSFSRSNISEFRKLAGGRVATAAHPIEIVAFLASPSSRLADLATRLLPGGDFQALQIPHKRGPLTVASRGLIARAKRAGKQVHVWTIDDQDHMHALLDAGVDGLFTDRTDILKRVLVERGEWNGR